ncbi:MAG: hypothetical protein JWM65_124 [Sphingomonas bacterium]|nr:hypothetical protein [Sphingomonas bacterium]
MLPWLLMLAASPAAPATPIEAERAFAADAQTLGQWTAFRKWAADDATMFVPKPVKTQVFLKDRRDPPKAIEWWPTASFISCDGSLAVNTGGWKRPDGTVGYFSTVWQRQADGGWKWIVDGGDTLTTPRERPTTPVTKSATCPNTRMLLGMQVESRGDTVGQGRSKDGTLFWDWVVNPDGKRSFSAWIWDGRKIRSVIADHIAAPPPAP